MFLKFIILILPILYFSSELFPIKYDYFGFIPDKLITLTGNNNTYIKDQNNIVLNLEKKYYTLDINVNKSGLYLISSLERSDLNYYSTGINYPLNFTYIGNERNYIDKTGLNIFKFKQNIFEIVKNLFGTYKLFNSNNIQENNIDFIAQKMNYTYIPTKNSSYDISISDLRSGDLLMITRFDGLDQIIMWGTGSFAGHTAILLEFNNTMYVCESTDKNPFGKSYWPPPYGVIKTEFNRWIKQAKNANFIVSLLKLNDYYYKKFNIERAINTFNNLEGQPYGYHNFLFGWIDTKENNYPDNLSSDFLRDVFSIVYRYDKNIGDKFINEALNKRLNNNYIKDYPETILQAYNNNISFSQLTTIVEKDEWIYSDGLNRVCDTLIMDIYHKSLLFNDINNTITATEFTPRDLYQLKIFKNFNKKCLNNNIGFCQILGNYIMDLPGFNSIIPYKNMNEYCPSIPPNYIRPDGC